MTGIGEKIKHSFDNLTGHHYDNHEHPHDTTTSADPSSAERPTPRHKPSHEHSHPVAGEPDPGYHATVSHTTYEPSSDNTAPNRNPAMHGDTTLEGAYYKGKGEEWEPKDRTLGGGSETWAPKDQTLGSGSEEWAPKDQTVGYQKYEERKD